MQLMNESEVRRFMMHYERLIRWMTRDLPQYADIVVDLDEQRRVQQLHFASGTGSR